MSRGKFTSWLLALTITLIGVAYLIHGHGEVGKFTDFTIYTILTFTVLYIVMFYFGSSTARSSNKYSFNNLIIGNMLLKMIVSVLVIFIYKKVYQVESRAILLPFLVIYLSYTIFETYFLTKLAKS